MYARKINYAANIDMFLALIEIIRKKGEKPSKYVLYRFSVRDGFEMIEFGFKDDAFFAFSINAPSYLRFHSGIPGIFDPWRNQQRYEKLWKKTTRWLFKVAVGPGYEMASRIHPLREWVKIGRPVLWRRRRQKKTEIEPEPLL